MAQPDGREHGPVARRGLMLVLSSPSGAGKTTLSRRLLEADPEVELSISVTTRPQRPGEIAGHDYHFVEASRFAAMRDAGELLEWAQVFGNFYGTPRAPVERALAQGRDVLFDVDWQGTQQLRETAPGDLVSIFVLPPSVAELEQRLHRRAQDSDGVIRGRMARAADEMKSLGRVRLRRRQSHDRGCVCRCPRDPRRRASEARAPDWTFRLRARPAGAAVAAREATRASSHFSQDRSIGQDRIV